MSDSIEIKFTAKQIPPAKFVAAVQQFFAVVQGVANNIAGAESPIKWTIEAEHGSAIIRCKALTHVKEASESTEAVSCGLRALRMGTSRIPRFFTNTELRAAKDLANLIDDDFPIVIKNGAAPEELTAEIGRTADSILRGERYEAFGSIEGAVSSMARSNQFNKFECEIRDQQSNKTIHCYFTRDEDARTAHAAFFRDKILVHGLIRYSKEGYPTSISADSIRVFSDESELPTVEDIQAIFQSYQ